VEQFVDQLDENGHRLVVRNGYHRAREVLTAAGAVEVKGPRVNDRRVDPDSSGLRSGSLLCDSRCFGWGLPVGAYPRCPDGSGSSSWSAASSRSRTVVPRNSTSILLQ
jgi:hypothetical protein